MSRAVIVTVVATRLGMWECGSNLSKLSRVAVRRRLLYSTFPEGIPGRGVRPADAGGCTDARCKHVNFDLLDGKI